MKGWAYRSQLSRLPGSQGNDHKTLPDDHQGPRRCQGFPGQTIICREVCKCPRGKVPKAPAFPRFISLQRSLSSPFRLKAAITTKKLVHGTK
ncbi:hypothetical protein ACOMHN_029682 [Nucella lapillus]